MSKISGEIITLSIDGSRAKSAAESRKPNLQTVTSNELSSKVAEQFKRLLRLLQRAKPAWVKAWEAQHKEETENDGEICKEEREAKAELEREAEANAKKEPAERTEQ